MPRKIIFALNLLPSVRLQAGIILQLPNQKTKLARNHDDECACSSRVVREHKRATKRTSSLVRSFAKRKQGYDTPISGNRPGPLRQSKPPSDICPSRISGQIFRLLWQSPYYNSKRQFVRIFPCQICFICSQYSKGHVHGHQQIRGP